jgi:WD40 repeat protein
VFDFEIEISSEGDGYRVAARSDAGDIAAVPVQFPFDGPVLGHQLQAVELALLRSAATVRRLTSEDEQPVQEFGRRLFEFALPSEVRANLIASRQNAAARGVPLMIRLKVAPPELAALPWEFLYDPTRDDYLSLSTPLVRYLDVFEPRRPLTVAPPLRILAMVARPDELDSLDVEDERRRLTEALAGLEADGRVQLNWVVGQTWWDLQAALDQTSWHIFHFIGHGGFDTRAGEGVLALGSEEGRVHRLAASDFALLLAEQRSLRLVVLNSCDTARASTTDRFSSTASTLMRRGIPAVVAMQYEISDQAAIAFARGFYTALAAQHPVEQAVTRGRRAVKLARQNTLEWVVPVLYLRSTTGALFDLVDIPLTPAPSTLETTPSDKPSAPAKATDPAAQPKFEPPRADSAVARPTPATGLSTTPTEQLRLAYDGEVYSVVFNLDGTRLATASSDATVRVWDSTTGKELARVSHKSSVKSVVFSPDGTQLATASSDATVRVWDSTTGKELIRVIPESTGKKVAGVIEHSHAESVVFSPDGTRLATSGNDTTVRVWDATTGKELLRVIHKDLVPLRMVYKVVFSPDGSRLASACEGGTARVWDSTTGKELLRIRHGIVLLGTVMYGVAFSPDGTRVATSGNDNTARVWDSTTGKELARVRHESNVNSVVFSPDGTRLATASADKTARVWDSTTGKELARVSHKSYVNSVVFSPDGTRLATAGNPVRVWNL